MTDKPPPRDYVAWLEWTQKQERRSDLFAGLIVAVIVMAGIVWLAVVWL